MKSIIHNTRDKYQQKLCASLNDRYSLNIKGYYDTGSANLFPQMHKFDISPSVSVLAGQTCIKKGNVGGFTHV